MDKTRTRLETWLEDAEDALDQALEEIENMSLDDVEIQKSAKEQVTILSEMIDRLKYILDLNETSTK
jgi:CHASE3 domain sensor protein